MMSKRMSSVGVNTAVDTLLKYKYNFNSPSWNFFILKSVKEILPQRQGKHFSPAGQASTKQQQIVQRVKEETGSWGIIMSGWCLHEPISTSSQVKKAHSSHGFQCSEYAISTALSALQWSELQQHSYNAHLVFKVFVPHGHICTELNLLQNVQWYETCSCRASSLWCRCRKKASDREINRISE